MRLERIFGKQWAANQRQSRLRELYRPCLCALHDPRTTLELPQATKCSTALRSSSGSCIHGQTGWHRQRSAPQVVQMNKQHCCKGPAPRYPTTNDLLSQPSMRLLDLANRGTWRQDETSSRSWKRASESMTRKHGHFHGMRPAAATWARCRRTCRRPSEAATTTPAVVRGCETESPRTD